MRGRSKKRPHLLPPLSDWVREYKYSMSLSEKMVTKRFSNRRLGIRQTQRWTEFARGKLIALTINWITWEKWRAFCLIGRNPAVDNRGKCEMFFSVTLGWHLLCGGRSLVKQKFAGDAEEQPFADLLDRLKLASSCRLYVYYCDNPNDAQLQTPFAQPQSVRFISRWLD